MKLKSGGEKQLAQAQCRDSRSDHRAETARNMDALWILMLQLALVGWGCSEPLSAALKRRSDFNVYASDFAAEYEPVSYAAVPLHAPVRLLQILSAAPLQDAAPLAALHERPALLSAGSLGSPVFAPSITQSMYAKPPSPYYASYYNYDEDIPEAGRHPPPPTIIYTRPYIADESSPNVLYASPNSNGGYTYRKKPTKKRIPALKKRPSLRPKPFIIRVHKYRVIRS